MERMKELYISRRALERVLAGEEELVQSKDSKGWHDEATLKLDEVTEDEED